MSNVSLKKVSEKGRLHALDLYANNAFFFPLISCVLRGSQRGTVYGNDVDCPSELYVEHAFGFSQIFGAHDFDFEKELETYLVEEKNFPIPKIRLYAPAPLRFMERAELKRVQSERQRFFLDVAVFEKRKKQYAENLSAPIEPVRSEILDEVEDAFGLVTRFWPSREAFLQHSHAFLLRCGGKMASICYAAALDFGKAEIDIYTLEAYRRHEYSFLTALAFIDHCLKNDRIPLWDCFTNNTPSMKLREKLGFVQSTQPYAFFTILRKGMDLV